MKGKTNKIRPMAAFVLMIMMCAIFVPITSDNAKADEPPPTVDIDMKKNYAAAEKIHLLAVATSIPLGPIGGPLFVGWIDSLLRDILTQPPELGIFRENEAMRLINDLDNLLRKDDQHMHNAAEFGELILPWLLQKAQFAASELWFKQDYIRENLSIPREDYTYTYDMDYVIGESRIMDDALNSIWASLYSYGATLNNYETQALLWGHVPWLEMEWGYVTKTVESAASGFPLIAEQTITFPSQFLDNTLRSTLATQKMNFGDDINNLAYIKNDSEITAIMVKHPPAGEDELICQVFDHNANMVGTASGDIYEAGNFFQFNLSSMELPSGRYSITTNIDVSNVWLFGLSAKNNVGPSAAISPAIISFVSDVNGSALCDFIFDQTIYAQGVASHIVWGRNMELEAGGHGPAAGYVGTVNDDEFPAVYFWHNNEGATLESLIDSANITYRNYIAPLFQRPDDLLELQLIINDMISISNTFAEVQFQVMIDTNGTAPVIGPSILGFDPSLLRNMERLTSDELYLIFVNYLIGIGIWFQDGNQNNIYGPDSVPQSYQSYELLIRGAIYTEQGYQLYNNSTIFTFFPQFRDCNLTSGQNNTIDGLGFIMKWGNAPNLTTWINYGDVLNTTMVKNFVDVENWTALNDSYDVQVRQEFQFIRPNYVFEIEEMWYKGNFTDYINFTLANLSLIVIELDPPLPPPVVPIEPEEGAASFLSKYWWIIVLAIGLIMLFLGFSRYVKTEKNRQVLYWLGGLITMIGIGGGVLWYYNYNLTDLLIFKWYFWIMILGAALVILGLYSIFVSAGLLGGIAKWFVIFGLLLVFIGVLAWAIAQIDWGVFGFDLNPFNILSSINELGVNSR